jgi:hypothetical protein
MVENAHRGLLISVAPPVLQHPRIPTSRTAPSLSPVLVEGQYKLTQPSSPNQPVVMDYSTPRPHLPILQDNSPPSPLHPQYPYRIYTCTRRHSPSLDQSSPSSLPPRATSSPPPSGPCPSRRSKCRRGVSGPRREALGMRGGAVAARARWPGSVGWWCGGSQNRGSSGRL